MKKKSFNNNKEKNNKDKWLKELNSNKFSKNNLCNIKKLLPSKL